MVSLARGATGPSGNAANGHTQRQSDITARGLHAGSEHACVRGVGGARPAHVSLILGPGCVSRVSQATPAGPYAARCAQDLLDECSRTATRPVGRVDARAALLVGNYPWGGHAWMGPFARVVTVCLIPYWWHVNPHPLLYVRRGPRLVAEPRRWSYPGGRLSIRAAVAFLFRSANSEPRRCRYAKIQLGRGWKRGADRALT